MALTGTSLSGGAAPLPKPAAARKPAAKPAVPRPGAAPAVTDYVIGQDDVLDITVSNHIDLNSTVTVRPDGKITFAATRAGEVMARGKTARALAAEIERRLARTLNNARVQVVVKEAHPRQARISGAVKTTGSFMLRNGWRVMDLVAAAGGLSTKATRITGRVIRGDFQIPFDVAKASAQPEGRDNVLLRPDDRVELDAQDFTHQLSVAGSVVRTGPYDLDEGLTVMGLLAQAGGPAPDAALRKAYVLRNGQQLPLDLFEAVNGTASPDSPVAKFTFRPGDVLYIPANAARYGVLGQVEHPNYYPVPEDASQTSVLKAVASAGGPAADGDLSSATITRTANGEVKTIPVDIAAIQNGTAPDTVILQPGDVLFVPRRDNQVRVIGPVAKPGAYPLKDGMTLIQLLAEAGSPANGAGLSKSYVLRDGVQMPVDLRAALNEGRADEKIAGFRLKRDDVLVIPDVSDQIHVIGQVTKQGAFNLDDGLTLASLMAQAGNTTDRAALSRAYVTRRNGTRVPLDLRSLVSGNPAPALEAFRFEAGDTLVVPENQARFAVLGQVSRPGYYLYPETPGAASALKALAEAGGPLAGEGGANLKQAGIVRTINGQVTGIPVDLEALLRRGNTTSNVILQPGDVLYIPPRKKGFKLGDALGLISPLAVLGRF